MAQTHPQVVVVTGASAGLGRAIARAFGERKASVGLLARGTDGLEAARIEIEALGGKAIVLPTDVADADAVDAAAERVERELGPIDVWINNAMVSVFSPVKLTPAEEFERVTKVTYLGYVYGTLAALKRMLPRDRGVIIQVGSALAHRSIPLQSAYCGAKHAVMGFTEALRTELLHDKSHVRVTIVQMPAMNTPQFEWSRSRMPRRPQPVPPIYQPEVGARAVVYASTHDRRELYVGWPTVTAIEGEKIAASVIDHYLAKTGYEAQLTPESAIPHRDNLWAPVPGDHGAHGRFGGRSRTKSSELWLATHRGLVALGVLALGSVASAALLPRREKSAWRRAFRHL